LRNSPSSLSQPTLWPFLFASPSIGNLGNSLRQLTLFCGSRFPPITRPARLPHKAPKAPEGACRALRIVVAIDFPPASRAKLASNAPAPIGQKAQPAAPRRTCTTAQAIAVDQAAGLRSGVHTAGADLKPAALTRRFFLWLWRVRKAVVVVVEAGFGAPLAEPADKIWRPTVVRTFFEGPGV
jgi:hypothetical protein